MSLFCFSVVTLATSATGQRKRNSEAILTLKKVASFGLLKEEMPVFKIESGFPNNLRVISMKLKSECILFC